MIQEIHEESERKVEETEAQKYSGEVHIGFAPNSVKKAREFEAKRNLISKFNKDLLQEAEERKAADESLRIDEDSKDTEAMKIDDSGKNFESVKPDESMKIIEMIKEEKPQSKAKIAVSHDIGIEVFPPYALEFLKHKYRMQQNQ